MRIDVTGFQIEIDLMTTQSRGTTAVNQFVDDPKTEVYYGALHASVTFLDLDMRITMDSHKGDWKNAGWARGRAWRMFIGSVTPADLFVIHRAIFERGKCAGADEARAAVRLAIGAEPL